MNEHSSVNQQLTVACGALALVYCGVRLPLQVMESQAGFYIGTSREYGPCSRESAEYWPKQALAEQALSTGDWTQRTKP